jgi:hypothetical protein
MIASYEGTSEPTNNSSINNQGLNAEIEFQNASH